MQYAECLKKYYNAVDGTFYDAINSYEEDLCLSRNKKEKPFLKSGQLTFYLTRINLFFIVRHKNIWIFNRIWMFGPTPATM